MLFFSPFCPETGLSIYPSMLFISSDWILFPELYVILDDNVNSDNLMNQGFTMHMHTLYDGQSANPQSKTIKLPKIL